MKEETADNAPLAVKKATPPTLKADDDDDKPIAQVAREAAAPKAKAKARAKATAIQKERVRQKTKREDGQPIATLIEEALPTPRKRAKAVSVASAAKKGADEVGAAQNVLRASRKAALATSKSRKKVERFDIGDPSLKRRVDPDDRRPIGRLRIS